jgi:hypothetical protein
MMYSFQRGLAAWRRRGQHADLDWWTNPLLRDTTPLHRHRLAVESPAAPHRCTIGSAVPGGPLPCVLSPRPASVLYDAAGATSMASSWRAPRSWQSHMASPSSAARSQAERAQACAQHAQPQVAACAVLRHQHRLRSSPRHGAAARRGVDAATVQRQHVCPSSKRMRGTERNTNRERGGRAWMVVGAGRGDGGGGTRLARSGRLAAARRGWQPRRGRCSLR